MDTPRSIQRTYLVLMLGNTLAASLIWGINTIFLLDAGLSNLEAFAANAFFTAGHGALRGADRDRRRHGRAARVVPARHGHARPCRRCCTCCCGRSRRRSGRGRSPRSLLGLGFTFFSGAVEAWLVDALTPPASRASWRRCSGAARSSAARRCSPARSPAACSRRQISLGVPFVLRGAVLAVMFVRRVRADARHRLHARKARPPAGRDAQDRRARRSSTAGACPRSSG